MKTWEKDTLLEREVTDMSDEAFELLIRELVSYSEALKCYSDQIEQSRRFEDS